MIGSKKVVVVMPAYNAVATLKKTVADIDRSIVDDIILVDDASSDQTYALAQQLGLRVHKHERNRGYGGNQKSCYRLAIQLNADIVVMVHPDYQYDPKLVPAMAYMIQSGIYDCILASRILGGQALRGGMPLPKFIANRGLTFIQNILVGSKLSEYHTGYRAFSRDLLETLPLEENSDDFLFDNQMICQAIAFGFRLGEVSCPTLYFPEASSISYWRSSIYALGVLKTSCQLALHRWGLLSNHRLFGTAGRRLPRTPV
jgi:glycosyltransferase involved in cell wall biosynthesis